MRVGIEVGGTFTDLVAVTDDGEVRIAKVPSTPANPDEGALNALVAADIDLSLVDEIVHGSTVATNAVLERKGARVCMFVTRGTRDLLHLQRHDRSAIYDLHYQKPEHVVARADIFELDERVGADGTVLLALDPLSLQQCVSSALGDTSKYDAVGICLLNSYCQPVHEQMVAEYIAKIRPDLVVTGSHEVTREFREYERASTTALAAYVQPVVAAYLDRLVSALADQNYHGTFSVIQSNGGRLPVSAIARNSIAALFSGPAAGVVGAVRQVAGAGYRNLITLDMGGTSTDVSLVSEGEPVLAPMTVIDGMPVKTPVIDIATVGAGGGSIAWVDDGGFLRVGPQSAGAYPGPACYMRGGSLPTLTDAHLLRRTMPQDTFLGGKMDINVDAAQAAFEELSRQSGIGVDELVNSTVKLAVANMVRATQQISTERGVDPRDFVLVPFGGAGPLHAAEVAEELEISTVVIPPNAGVLSAVGLLTSDYLHYRSVTNKTLLADDNMAVIRATLQELAQQAQTYLNDVGVVGEPQFDAFLEMRYVGQAFEVSVPVALGSLSQLMADDLEAAFAAEHTKVFEFSKPPGDPAEVVSFRVGARLAPPPLPTLASQQVASPTSTGHEILGTNGESVSCVRLTRQDLGSTPQSGPIIIQDGTSTVFVPESWFASLDDFGNILLSRKA